MLQRYNPIYQLQNLQRRENLKSLYQIFVLKVVNVSEVTYLVNTMESVKIRFLLGSRYCICAGKCAIGKKFKM